jgi:hypothetical protein
MRKAIVKRVRTSKAIKARVEFYLDGSLLECTRLISIESALKRADQWEFNGLRQ